MTIDACRPPADPALLAAEDSNTISLAASLLLDGGVVAIPTDTVYGLAASLARPEAIDRLYVMKSRPAGKAIPVLISDLDQIAKIAIQAPAVMLRLAERFWPGALTLVVEARAWLPHQVTSIDSAGRQTIAVRLPNHSLARTIIGAAGGALAVTSANRSGNREALSALQVRQLAIDQPDAVVDGGHVAGGMPSTIVSVVGSTIAIVREGAIPSSEVFAYLESSGLGSGAFPSIAV